MKFNYVNIFGNLKFLNFNGLFLKIFFNFNFIYQFLIYYSSFYRICKSVQKSRSFVNFSTKKLYKQKGTGKARSGSFSSPIRVKGGKAFPNLYFTNFSSYFNKKSYKFSYFLIYSNLFINNFFFILEDLFFIDYKSKILSYFFKFLIYKKIFLLTIKIEKNFFFSIINSKNFFVFYFYNFNPIFLLKFSKIFISKSCIDFFFND
ncbi:50S ribosomal subunit protein L4 [Candidatus Nasuia deltocephalinicola]|uniref:Large ribosomal subunit protein uL4 n=1 Tax=Candidatus Nasuia deltocephalincola TaxID=1160784 RepID=A0A974WLP0_9PROT|nr:50S ribosomal protein L4 [Candidatus Nasuia deltocephalinicola]BEH03949.1 50S ribosomal subunit protein L4 [Candidatus Nasuia deltocephalinicola]